MSIARDSWEMSNGEHRSCGAGVECDTAEDESGLALMDLPALALLEIFADVLEGGGASSARRRARRLALVSKRFATGIVPAFLTCRMSAARVCGAPCRPASCTAEERVRICRQCLAAPAGACAACEECNARVMACSSCGRLQLGCWHIFAGAGCAGCSLQICSECTAVCSVPQLLRVGADGACRRCRKGRCVHWAPAARKTLERARM